MRDGTTVSALLRSSEPSLVWKVRSEILGEPTGTPRMRALQQQVRRSPRVRAILQRSARLGRPGTNRGVYYKWQGAHWALAHLADLGYPAGDESLAPMRDRVLGIWLRESFYREFVAKTTDELYGRVGVPKIRGRYRRCASQQGNALYAIVRLGLVDERCAQLAERLLHWQWADGGWNCDRHPEADTSSFMETRLPMQGLAAYARDRRSGPARAAAVRASEVFLRRRLFRRVSDGRVIRPDFLRLHYPVYYHYDLLAGLEGMVTVGRIRDPRCTEALDLLERKRLPDGGWPAEAKYYRYAPGEFVAGGEYVDWGGTGRARMNPWVTGSALAVLSAAGRIAL